MDVADSKLDRFRDALNAAETLAKSCKPGITETNVLHGEHVAIGVGRSGGVHITLAPGRREDYAQLMAECQERNAPKLRGRAPTDETGGLITYSVV